MSSNSGGSSTGVPEARRETFAAVLGKSLAPPPNKNVLEAILQKDIRGSFAVTESECAKFLTKLGINLVSSGVEAVQICPNERGIIFITMKETVDISKYCRYDVIDVSASGRAVHVKPAGKREVTVYVKDIHPNTKDEVVMHYLECFGKLVTRKVVYGVYHEGPLKGLKNGDRSYRIEIKPGTNLGSYHVLDGQRVTLRYPGQSQTCARCPKTSMDCKGRGIARKCEAEGGQKQDFVEYITNLWVTIGYSPISGAVRPRSSSCESLDDIDLQIGGEFTPNKYVSATDKYTGVCIKQFSSDIDDGDIFDLLVESGLPEGKKEAVSISKNGTVIIRDLLNSECLKLINNIHGRIYCSKKLYCNGIVPLTPEKETVISVSPPEQPINSATNIVQEDLLTGTPPPPMIRKTEPLVNDSMSNLAPPSLLSPLISHQWPTFERNELARRHSISLLNRTPPSGSLASELLSVTPPQPQCPTFERNERARSLSLSLFDRKPSTGSQASELLGLNNKQLSKAQALLSSVMDLTETLSDFNSCRSSISSSESSDHEAIAPRGKQEPKKRKRKKSPNQKEQLKKGNFKVSPDKVVDKSN